MKKTLPTLLLLLSLATQAQAYFANCTADLIDPKGLSKSLAVRLPKTIKEGESYALPSFEGQKISFRISEGSALFPLDIMSVESKGPLGDTTSGAILSENGQASVLHKISSRQTNASLTIICVSSDKPVENLK